MILQPQKKRERDQIDIRTDTLCVTFGEVSEDISFNALKKKKFNQQTNFKKFGRHEGHN